MRRSADAVRARTFKFETFEERVVFSADAVVAPLDVLVGALPEQPVAGDGDRLVAQAPKLTTLHDSIPDLAANPTVTSVKTGFWSDASIWSTGKVPGEGAVVRIAAGHTVTYNRVSDETIQAIGVDGTLRFATQVSTKMKVQTILVYKHGSLQIGLESAPVAENVRAEIVFADRPLDLANDPEQWGNGLIALGHVRMYGREFGETYLRLAKEVRAGDTVLELAEPAAKGWRVGDVAFVPDTRQLAYAQHTPRSNFSTQREFGRITAISADRKTFYLDRAMKFDHLGARNANGQIDFLPHVFTTSRNIYIHSERPSGVRGHIAFLDTANVDIRYANFMDLGRTRMDAIDNTVFNADGSVAHLGTNQDGRFAMHFLHLRGPWKTPANGYQFTFVGNSICWSESPSAPKDIRWGVVLNNSHYGWISKNIIRNSGGSAFFAQSGSESYNVFEKNFVAGVHGTGGRDNGGLEGAGFWFRGPNNVVRDNVVTNVLGDGVEAAYGYKFYQVYAGPVKMATQKGAVPWKWVDVNKAPILEFSGNEVYGATESGLTLWWVGTFGSTPKASGQSVIKDLKIWHVYHHMYYGYETDNVLFDGLVIRGDWSVQDYSRGMYFGDYPTSRNVVRNADIQGMKVGIEFSDVTMGEFRVENSYLRNHYNTAISTMWSVGGAGGLPARRIVLDNVRMDAPIGRPLVAMKFQYRAVVPGMAGGNYIQKDEIFVRNHQGRAGEDFQVFWAEQAAGYIVPHNNANNFPARPVVGAPEAGLTNAQAWAKYGVAIAGAVAPLGATTMAEFSGGLVYGLSGASALAGNGGVDRSAGAPVALIAGQDTPALAPAATTAVDVLLAAAVETVAQPTESAASLALDDKAVHLAFAAEGQRQPVVVEEASPLAWDPLDQVLATAL